MSSLSSLNSSLITIPASGIMSAGEYRIGILILVPISLAVGLFGAAGNIANIMVYFRMGFSESTHVSLTALACSDLGGILTAMFSQIFFLPIFENVPIVSELLVLTITSYPHIIMTRLSGFITAFISLERYLCVFLPLKIKSIFTPRRTCIVIVCIFLVVVPPMINIYFRHPHGWVFFPERNRSLLTALTVEDPVIATSFMIWQAYVSMVLPATSFVIVTFCTIFLSISLQRSKKWRDSNRNVSSEQGQKGSSGTTREKTSNKELKIIRMVVAVATVFIISTIPSCIHVTVVMLVPEFYIRGRFAKIHNIAGHLFFLIDLINCSVNVIIYYRMSTKFRQTANELFNFKCFSRCRKAKKNPRLLSSVALTTLMVFYHVENQ